jgi:hypothetical protein
LETGTTTAGWVPTVVEVAFVAPAAVFALGDDVPQAASITAAAHHATTTRRLEPKAIHVKTMDCRSRMHREASVYDDELRAGALEHPDDATRRSPAARRSGLMEQWRVTSRVVA